jgi:hypothetical protein
MQALARKPIATVRPAVAAVELTVTAVLAAPLD